MKMRGRTVREGTVCYVDLSAPSVLLTCLDRLLLSTSNLFALMNNSPTSVFAHQFVTQQCFQYVVGVSVYELLMDSDEKAEINNI